MEQLAPQQFGTPTSPTPERMGRIRTSWYIAKGSWKLLMKDKEIMGFPILSFLCIAFTVGVFFLISRLIAPALQGMDRSIVTALSYAFYLALYVSVVFVAVFFQAALTSIVYARIHGEDKTFANGLESAFRKIKKLFLWAALAGTIGVLLRVARDKSKFLGRLIVGSLNVVWSVATYFIVPVLLFEEIGIKDSVVRSAETFKKAWGETAFIYVSSSLVFMLIALSGIPVVIGIMILLGEMLSGPIILALFASYIAFVLILIIIGAALEAIFKVVLYEYVNTGRITGEFAPGTLESAVRKV